jgi:hypothetical protein
VWRAHFGEGGSGSGSASSVAAVPEPGTALLWLMATGITLFVRRKAECHTPN